MTDNKIISEKRLASEFYIQHVPESIPWPESLFGTLPLTAKINLGGTLLGVENTIYQSAGYFFSFEYLFQQIISISEGNQETINFDERYPVPITFLPENSYCTIKLEKNKIRAYASFNKDRVKDQVVKLEDVVFELTNFINDFLLDLDAREIHFILDELEEGLIEVVSHPLYTSVLSQKEIKPYVFDVERSAREALKELHYKQQSYPRYEKFLSRLKGKEPSVWRKILTGSKLIYPDKSDEEIYKITEIELPDF